MDEQAKTPAPDGPKPEVQVPEPIDEEKDLDTAQEKEEE